MIKETKVRICVTVDRKYANELKDKDMNMSQVVNTLLGLFLDDNIEFVKKGSQDV